jgi:predicted nucleotide-binding protein
MKQMVARFLEKLGTEVVILHEQPDAGKSIMEKLESYGKTDFAVVLLTPDDVGRAASTRCSLRPRARQNVVLELGYFLALLGRHRVSALLRGDVEFPSDYAGIVYTPLDDAGGWKLSLARNLREAGMRIDAHEVV